MTREDVLEFWFGDLAADRPVADEVKRRWWIKDPGFDREIGARFGASIASAAAGDLDAWADDPVGIVALVVLLDQFTRNTRRGTGAMYDNDEQALQLSRMALDAGIHEGLHPDHRCLLVMPFMHSEDPVDQERCVAWTERFAEDMEGGAWAESAKQLAHYARLHRDIVVRWGRFPHRNALLGRASTAEEIDFLKTPGSSF